jgi:cellulose synthase/poly-beta-1,6-N-acetylglucosamine synthase-like glycosyltransferase
MKFRSTRPISRTFHLPRPPSDLEMVCYVRQHLWAINLAALASFAAVAYTTARVSLLATPCLLLLLPLILAAVWFLTGMQANLRSGDFDLQSHLRMVASWQPAEYPSVDVLLPICGEDLEVLVNSWRHVRVLDYPAFTVHCLDDGDENDELRLIAEGLGFNYLRRPDRGWFKKAGNLRFGYQNSSADYVVVFDADFVPREDFLRQTLPYLIADPSLGIVQTPQFFATNSMQGWLERGACSVQEMFYRVSQVARDRHDAAICVGTNAVYRRAALADNDGTTLIEHSEDLHTGFDLRRLGWGLRYVPVNLAAGLCPDQLARFFRQQYRWCAGSMSLCFSRKFWSTPMSLTQRACYASGFLYYTLTAVFIFTAPLIPLTMLWFFPRDLRLVNYLVLAPALFYWFVAFRLWARSSYRIEALSVRVIYSWAHAFALIDRLRGRVMGWDPTGVSTKEGRVVMFRSASIVWGAGTAMLLLAGCALRIQDEGRPLQYLPVSMLALIYAWTYARILLES